jgi:hypothetical protein
MGGGSSRGSLSKKELEELLEKVKRREESTRDAGFETEVSSYINDLLAQFNNRNQAVIQKYLDEIVTTFSEDIEDTVRLLFGGSISKRTYVEGLSDVDALVLLNGSELQRMTPREAQGYFFDKLRERFPRLPVKRGALAITIKFSDAEIQLLPAVKHGSGYRIPDADGNTWSHIKPRKFSASLTAVNQQQGNRVVPAIKVAKAINSALSKEHQLTGYHIESLAVNIFRQYQGPKTTKAMISHFFKEAPRLIKTPLPDVTGQSTFVDEYLGKKDSQARQRISGTLERIGRDMTRADNARSIEEWKAILGSK